MGVEESGVVVVETVVVALVVEVLESSQLVYSFSTKLIRFHIILRLQEDPLVEEIGWIYSITLTHHSTNRNSDLFFLR